MINKTLIYSVLLMYMSCKKDDVIYIHVHVHCTCFTFLKGFGENTCIRM